MTINYQTINYPVAMVMGETFLGVAYDDRELVGALADATVAVTRDGDDWVVTETTTAGAVTHTLPIWDINNRCEVSEADVWRHLAWLEIDRNFEVNVEDAASAAGYLADLDEGDHRRQAYEKAVAGIAEANGDR